jgi:hypothetical protein
MQHIYMLRVTPRTNSDYFPPQFWPLYFVIKTQCVCAVETVFVNFKSTWGFKVLNIPLKENASHVLSTTSFGYLWLWNNPPSIFQEKRVFSMGRPHVWRITQPLTMHYSLPECVRFQWYMHKCSLIYVHKKSTTFAASIFHETYKCW